VFNAVEGNTTFYGVPAETTVARWRDDTPPGFRFSFKVPRAITHDQGLADVADATAAFLDRMAPLGDRRGPFLLQLGPSFGPDRLPLLDSFLERAPADTAWAVEVRHPAFFAAGPAEADLVALLRRRGADRVTLDTRALRAGDPRDPAMAAVLHQKPDLPPRFEALGPHPMLRFVAHRDAASDSDPWLAEWADVVAAWIAEGRAPTVFIHHRDDFHAPRVARRFHTLLAERAEVGTLPPWPAERAEEAGVQPRLL
jgi:uncharacterized protein YecE (DUF72 family)